MYNSTTYTCGPKQLQDYLAHEVCQTVTRKYEVITMMIHLLHN